MNDNDNDRRIDDELQRAFTPPPVREFSTMAEQVATPPATSQHLWPWLAAAAALLALLLIFTPEPEVRGPNGHDGLALGVMWVAAYEDAAARGFTGGCCETGFNLPQACQNMFACRVDVVSSGSVSVLGGYCGLETGGCMALLARDGGNPVCVYVVPRDCDPGVALPDDSELYLARRELGDLVLYALSPEPAAASLTQFVVP